MTTREQARIVVATERQFNRTLHEVVKKHSENPEEQLQIASGVLALLLKKMYQERGRLWLEQVLTMVLKPE
jgi:hypothetical protein